MRLASLLLCAWLATTAVAVVLVGSADAKRPPRAAQILQPKIQTWVCPEFPGGRIVASRAVCFIEGWPEPTL